jgi:two-component system cell cycle sensor histidine kinase/response regulator CckA
VNVARGEMTAWRPIVLQGRPVGRIVLLSDLGEIADRIRLYGATVLLMLLASSLIAFFLSSKLRALIATPISQLVDATTSVSETRDYSVRVEKTSSDELGVLVDAFNDMLAAIHSRDTELTKALAAREEALEEAETARNSLHTTLASIGDAVISTDIDGRIVFANSVAQVLLGWPEAELTGKPLDEVFRIINEFGRGPVESPVTKVMREGKSVGLARHTILIARDGSEIPIDNSGASIQHEGRTVGVVLVFRDVTERRRAERDTAYLAALVESTGDAIIGSSPEGVIQSWNPAAERLYGYRAEEMIGHSTRELTPPDHAHEESAIFESLRNGDRMVHLETVRQCKDGALVDVSLTISPIRDDTGQIMGISHLARDITEQKRNAEKLRQTQKLESIGILAGGIAHDFNNLLSGIMGNASLALDEVDPASRVKSRLEDVISASEKAAQLTRQMLAYSGRGQFLLEQINLSARIRETAPLIQPAIRSSVELRLNLDDRSPAIEADTAQIQQLVMNIIINAAEAIPEGQRGTVTVTTRREMVDEAYIRQVGAGAGELKRGPYVLFEVVDTGTGMDEATKSRIFDPFFTTKFTGRGLGLAAVLGIVRGHEGFIGVSSTPGQGTTFRVLLPALDVHVESTPADRQPAKPADAGGGKVLVVDDEEIVRKMAKQVLERYKFRVLLAEDGARGVELYRRESAGIDCVLLDLTMPVMNGEEALARMRQMRDDVPVILSSGYNEAEARRRFTGMGLAGFLQKPYRAGALVEIVQSVMRHAGRDGAS